MIIANSGFGPAQSLLHSLFLRRFLWRFSSSRFRVMLFSGSIQLLGLRAAIRFLPMVRRNGLPPRSVTRVSACQIAGIVEQAVRKKFGVPDDASAEVISERIERIVLSDTLVRITLKSADQAEGSSLLEIEVPWSVTKPSPSFTHLPLSSDRKPDQKLLQALARSHAWLADLKSNRYASIEELAEGASVHPKVVRQALRLDSSHRK